MSAFEVIGSSFTTVVDPAEDYHHSFLTGDGKIWVFGQKYMAQPNFNWGHRIVSAGTYAVAFDVASKQWGEKKEVAAATSNENDNEAFFVLNGLLYMLLFNNFGDFQFNKLFKWNGAEFESVDLQAPAPVSADGHHSHNEVVVAEGSSDSERYLVTRGPNGMSVYRLSLSGSGASIEHVKDVGPDVNTMHGKAVSALHSQKDNRLLIFFGVMGCGFRWEKKRLIVVDLATKEANQVMIGEDESPAPGWDFAGAMGHGLLANGDWIHAGGSVQVGMTNSKYEGSVWALSDVGSSPKWVKKSVSIPEEQSGEVCVDADGTIYIVGKAGVAKAHL